MKNSIFKSSLRSNLSKTAVLGLLLSIGTSLNAQVAFYLRPTVNMKTNQSSFGTEYQMNTYNSVTNEHFTFVNRPMFLDGHVDLGINVGIQIKEKHFIENVGYAMGALTNISDGVNALDNAKAIKQAAQSPEEQAAIVNKKFKTEGRFIKDKYIGPNGRGNPEIAWKNGIIPETDMGLGAFNHDVYYYQKGADGALSAFFNTNVISSDRTLLQLARAARSSEYSFNVRFGTSIFLGLKTAIVNSYIFYPSLIIRR